MGQVMVGFSTGSLIGPPIGGVLYKRLGYQAPFIFALCLLFSDFVLRLAVIEKHVAMQWIRAGVDIPGVEARGYTPPSIDSKGIASPAPIPLSSNAEHELETVEPPAKPNPWPALLHMVTGARPVTNFALAMLNGLILGGLIDTGMTLWLKHEYSLNSFEAGLEFMGFVIPSVFASSFAGWVTDKYRAKWIAVIGLEISIPAHSLLIIQGSLPLFIFFLVILGVSLSFFLTPTMQDLSVVVAMTPGLPSTAAYRCFKCAPLDHSSAPSSPGNSSALLEFGEGGLPWVPCPLASPHYSSPPSSSTWRAPHGARRG